MTPKNIHKIFIPQKIFIFLETPQKSEIQNFEPQKMTPAYVCMKISEYTPPPPTHTPSLNISVLSQTANCDFSGVQAGWSEYSVVQKRFELATL